MFIKLFVVCHRGDAVGWTEALLDGAVLRPLLADAALLALFVAQHSLLAWAPVKRASGALLGPLSRAAYCSSTALVLQVSRPTGHAELQLQLQLQLS